MTGDDTTRAEHQARDTSCHAEGPQPRLTLLPHTAEVPPVSSSTLRSSSRNPFHRPQTTWCSWNGACRQRRRRDADQMVLVQLTRAHEAEAFVTQAIAQARAQSPVPLVHKGFRTTSVLLLGGTRLVLETPYLREDRRGRRGRRRRTRGPHGAGCYPVLEALGIADRVSPATRSEIALHVVQAASYREAAASARPSGPGVRRVESGAHQHGDRRDQ